MLSARLPTASAASLIASDERRVGVAGAGDVLGAAPNSIATRGLRDHVAGVGADDVDAEHAIGLGVRQDLHEAVGLVIALARPLAMNGNLPTL